MLSNLHTIQAEIPLRLSLRIERGIKKNHFKKKIQKQNKWKKEPPLSTPRAHFLATFCPGQFFLSIEEVSRKILARYDTKIFKKNVKKNPCHQNFPNKKVCQRPPRLSTFPLLPAAVGAW